MNKNIFNMLLLVLLVFLTACGNMDNLENSPQGGSNLEPLPPISDDAPPIGVELSKGNVYLNEVQLFIMESYPIQVSINIVGDLPTPCNNLNYSIGLPYGNFEIMIEVFSEADLNQVCIEVLDPFEKNISLPLENIEDGIYSVFVNGELAGEFSYPG